MTIERTKKALQRGLSVLAIAGIVLGGTCGISFMPQPARADGVGVSDSVLQGIERAIQGIVSNILSSVINIFDKLTDLFDMTKDEFDEVENDIIGVGQAQTAAIQGETEAIVRSLEMVDKDNTLDLKNQFMAEQAAKYTPPPNNNFLCLMIKAKQMLFILEQFAQAVENGLLTGVESQNIGPTANGFGGKGIHDTMNMICGKMNGVATGSALNGNADCVAKLTYLQNAHLSMPSGFSVCMRLPKLTVQSVSTDGGTVQAATFSVDQNDPCQVAFMAAFHGLSLKGLKPSPPYGDLLKTREGEALYLTWSRLSASQSESLLPLAYRIAANTAMNCQNADGNDPFKAGCQTVIDGCKAIKKANIKLYENVDCDKGIDLHTAMSLVSAQAASNSRYVSQLSANGDFAEGMVASDQQEEAFLTAHLAKLYVDLPTPSPIIPWHDLYTVPKEVAEQKLRQEMEDEKRYGQNERENKEDKAASARKTRARLEGSHRAGRLTPIRDDEAEDQDFTAPAVLNR